jgi:hypothetical protein
MHPANLFQAGLRRRQQFGAWHVSYGAQYGPNTVCSLRMPDPRIVSQAIIVMK